MRGSFFLGEAARSIRSNVAIAMAAITTVAVAMFVLGAFIPSFLLVQSAVADQKDKIDIRFYVADAATVDQIEDLQGQLEQMQASGQIESVNWVSKDEALARARELFDDNVLDELATNVFPASFDVKPDDPARADAIISDIGAHPALHKELPVGYPRETSERLLSVARFIQWTGLALILILGLASLLLIANTIRLSIFARRREVEVMKLVGGTNWFIRWPFVIEGVICGLVGALIAVGLLWAAKIALVEPWLNSNDQSLTQDDAATLGFLALGGILILAGAAVGAIGSGLTLRRFLKV